MGDGSPSKIGGWRQRLRDSYTDKHINVNTEIDADTHSHSHTALDEMHGK